MVDVIIPAYNVKQHLEWAVTSVLMQPACRVILVDDGSNDGTERLCDELMQHDRVQVLHQPNRGVSAARNAGLAVAQAEWVMLLDADDTLLPGCMEKLLQGAGEAQAVQGLLVRPHQEQKEQSTMQEVCLSGTQALDKALRDPTGHLHTHGWMIRRECCQERFDERLCMGEDGEWMLRVLRHVQKVAFLPVETYVYHLRADSAVHGGQPEVTQQYLKTLSVAQKTLDTLPDSGAVAKYRLTHLLLILTHGVVSRGTWRDAWRQQKEICALCREKFREDLRFVSWCPKNAQEVVFLLLRMHGYALARQAVLIRQRQNADAMRATQTMKKAINTPEKGANETI